VLGPFLKKDLLIYIRNRMEMLMSLITPIILILVLSTTTSSWVENSKESLQMTVAIVNEDQQSAALDESSPLHPIRTMMQMLSSEQIASFVKTVSLDRVTADQRLRDKEIEAIITIPSGFSQATLDKMRLNKGSGGSIALTADHRASLKVDVLQDMLDGFTQSLNFHSAIAIASNAKTEPLVVNERSSIAPVGGLEKIEGVQMLTAFQYYSIAMSIISAVFISSAGALRAITEQREHVFQRILLTGSHPLRYLAGKAGSTFCISFLLLTILIILSHFIFHLFPGRSISFWLGMALISAFFSLSVAALSALFTSLTFRIKDTAVNGLLTLVIMIIGTIGGSFLPIYLLPDWLKQVGEWTPNGLALSVFIQWIQQDSFSNLTRPFINLVIFSIGMILAAAWIFPRRGRI
jgi:ABC-2 type transport system permease protein